MFSQRLLMYSNFGFDCRKLMFDIWGLSIGCFLVFMPFSASIVRSYPSRSYLAPMVCLRVPNQFL